MTSMLLPKLLPALLPLLPAFLVLVVGALVAAWLTHPSVRGRLGERRVNRRLRALDAHEYRVYADLILPSLDGTTQIDHVMVSRFGVFVIETKNFGGLIVGGPRDAEWTQWRGRRRYRFQNPLRQNHRHAKAVEAALGISESQVIALVVFAGRARIHARLEGHIVPLEQLAAFITRHQVAMFSEDQRDELCHRLHRARLDGQPDAHRAHVKALRERHRRRP